MLEKRAGKYRMERGGGIRREEGGLDEESEGSSVPRSTIIIVTFDQGGTLVSFMDHCFFPSSHPTEDSAG